MEEVRKRRTSIIVRGIEADSLATFRSIFDQVTAHLVGSAVPFSDTVCVSREKRLFRIKVNDDKARKNLLDNAKLLQNSTFPDVYINRDLTYKHTQEFRARCMQRNGRASTNSQSQAQTTTEDQSVVPSTPSPAPLPD